MPDFAFYDPAKAPCDLVAVAREAWPGRDILWMAVSDGESLHGRHLAAHCARTFAAMAEYDSEPLDGGRKLHVGLLPPNQVVVAKGRRPRPSVACELEPAVA